MRLPPTDDLEAHEQATRLLGSVAFRAITALVFAIYAGIGIWSWEAGAIDRGIIAFVPALLALSFFLAGQQAVTNRALLRRLHEAETRVRDMEVRLAEDATTDTADDDDAR